MNSTHITVAHVDKRLSILTVKQETSNGIVPVNIIQLLTDVEVDMESY